MVASERLVARKEKVSHLINNNNINNNLLIMMMIIIKNKGRRI